MGVWSACLPSSGLIVQGPETEMGQADLGSGLSRRQRVAPGQLERPPQGLRGAHVRVTAVEVGGLTSNRPGFLQDKVESKAWGLRKTPGHPSETLSVCLPRNDPSCS